MTGRKASKDSLADLLKDAARQAAAGANVASAVNVGGSGKRTHVTSKKRVVQRDGVTTQTEEHYSVETDQSE